MHDKKIGTTAGEFAIGGMAEMAVHPDFRGRGLVKLMLNAALLQLQMAIKAKDGIAAPLEAIAWNLLLVEKAQPNKYSGILKRTSKILGECGIGENTISQYLHNAKAFMEEKVRSVSDGNLSHCGWSAATSRF